MTIVRRTIPSDAGRLGADLHPVLARVYAARGIESPGELDTSAAALENFSALGGIDAAVEILADALARAQRILIVGDYDADGATSTAVMVRGLTAMGASQVDYLVPNRFEFGYGLSPEIVAVAAERSPDVLITVDNGIASIDGVSAAREAGMRVIVTDHHLPGQSLPAADAIVNPNCPGDNFASKHLAGVGVAFYLLAALRAHLRTAGWFERRKLPLPNIAELLDLVALGTVADVVPLDHNNRILVRQGLARIRARRCVPGILALLEIGGRTASTAVATDLGFAVGPRLNAAGRLEDMTIGIECLLADSFAPARRLAVELDQLNQSRKAIESDMNEQASHHVDQLVLDDALPPALSLYEPSWHPGVVGIVASRVKERTHRPVVAFARDGEHLLKGSARSVRELHIKDALEAVSARRPGLLIRFGGHAMAAGVSIAQERFGEFESALSEVVEEVLGPDGAGPERLSDGSLAPDERTLALAQTLRSAGPWGQAFAEPQFDDEFEVLDQRVVGGSHLRLRLECPSSGQRLDAIAFGLGDQHPCPALVRVLYRLDVNTYRGVSSVQLNVQHLEPA